MTPALLTDSNIAAAGVANISHNKLASATAGYLLMGNASNAVTATAVRLAPPLTVSDAEIDEAVALVAQVLA